MTTDVLAVLEELARVLERLGLRYVVGGSLASGSWGEPRSTHDVDLLVELPAGRSDELVAALGDAFYVDRDSVREAVRDARAFNVIHLRRYQKVDLFVAGAGELDRAQLADPVRRRLAGPAGREFPVTSAELMILRKLDWFRLGGETSERQWRDVLAMLRVQAGRLDWPRIEALAARSGLEQLLARARASSAG